MPEAKYSRCQSIGDADLQQQPGLMFRHIILWKSTFFLAKCVQKATSEREKATSELNPSVGSVVNCNVCTLTFFQLDYKHHTMKNIIMIFSGDWTTFTFFGTLLLIYSTSLWHAMVNSCFIYCYKMSKNSAESRLNKPKHPWNMLTNGHQSSGKPFHTQNIV